MTDLPADAPGTLQGPHAAAEMASRDGKRRPGKGQVVPGSPTRGPLRAATTSGDAEEPGRAATWWLSETAVVAGDINASYLMMLVGDFPPAMATPPASGLPSVGLMPENMPPLCCQKLDALERWISSGSPTQ